MTGPNPQFSDQLSPSYPLTAEQISQTSTGSCDPLDLLPCQSTTEPNTNKLLIIRGNKKRVMYLPWLEANGAEDCQDSKETDKYGSSCEFYDNYFERCGWYDTESFIANEMCCACKI